MPLPYFNHPLKAGAHSAQKGRGRDASVFHLFFPPIKPFSDSLHLACYVTTSALLETVVNEESASRGSRATIKPPSLQCEMCAFSASTRRESAGIAESRPLLLWPLGEEGRNRGYHSPALSYLPDLSAVRVGERSRGIERAQTDSPSHTSPLSPLLSTSSPLRN